MKEVKVTIIGTVRIYDYCSKQLCTNEDGGFDYNAFTDNYYETGGFMNYELGGMFIDDGDEDMMKKKGKYIKTKEFFHNLFRANGEHPLPVVCHVRDFYECKCEYTIQLKDDEEFDIKKVQLVKSEYELYEEPFFIVADYIMYNGEEWPEETSFDDCCTDDYEQEYEDYEITCFQ